jgi:hypothetical protein
MSVDGGVEVQVHAFLSSARKRVKLEVPLLYIRT